MVTFFKQQNNFVKLAIFFSIETILSISTKFSAITFSTSNFLEGKE